MPKARILIADDDRVILATLSEGLVDAGYEVLTASDGDTAVRLCEEASPDLAILDMRMPGMDGIDVACKLRAASGVPFLFLSAYGDKETVHQAVEEGALGYLVKPLDLPQILPSVEAALARAREFQKTKKSEFHLSRALAQGREVSLAMGLLMERRRLSEQDALESLRSYARSQRRKLQEVAQEMVQAAEVLNLPLESPPFGGQVARKTK